jgi:fibronectin-binding autotransporter adhesin
MKKYLAMMSLVALAGETMAATEHTWTGGGSTGYWSRPENWSGNLVPPANSSVILAFPSGLPRKISTNDIPGLVVTSMTVADYGMSFHGTGAGVELAFNGPVTLGSASVVFNASLPLRLSGGTTFDLGTSVVGVGTYSPSSVVFGGTITGPGSLTVSGSGGYGLGNGGLVQFTARGANTYQGSTTFQNSVQVEMGNWNYAPGNVPQILVQAGTTSVPGAMTVRNGADVEWKRNDQVGNGADVTLLQGSRLDLSRYSDVVRNLVLRGRLESELYNATTYGRLSVIGTINITSNVESGWNDYLSDQLRITRYSGYTPVANTSFTILSNDASDAIVGTFYGWPNLATRTVGGLTFKLRYAGGTGNDLTFSNP